MEETEQNTNKNGRSHGWHYPEIFSAMLNTKGLPELLYAISETIVKYGLSKYQINNLLRQKGIGSITTLKEDMLDLLLSYLYIVLDDHWISEEEYKDFTLLKILFKIREGDFYHYRYHQVKEVFQSQLINVCNSNTAISKREALLLVNLQDMFDLGYDQFLEFEAGVSLCPISGAVDFKPKFRINTGKNNQS